ncbi:hypothetical protein OESDEN_17132, partial [Oesophagostomum dentatum]
LAPPHAEQRTRLQTLNFSYDAIVPEHEKKQPLLSALYFWPNTGVQFEDIGSDVVELQNEKALALANILRADTPFVGCAVAKCGETATAACFYSKPYDAIVPEHEKKQPLLSALYFWPNTGVQFEDIGSDVVELQNEKALALANILRADTLFVGCAEAKCGDTATAACFYSKPDVKVGELVYKAGQNCLKGGPCTTYPNSSCESDYFLCKKN